VYVESEGVEGINKYGVDGRSSKGEHGGGEKESEKGGTNGGLWEKQHGPGQKERKRGGLIERVRKVWEAGGRFGRRGGGGQIGRTAHLETPEGIRIKRGAGRLQFRQKRLG